MSARSLSVWLFVGLSAPSLALARPGSAGAAVSAARALPELSGLELSPQAVVRAKTGTVVRLRQSYRGLPVLGAAAAVRVGGSPRLLASSLARGLSLSTVAALPARAAVAVASSVAGLPAGGEPAELAILPDPGAPGGGRLVWSVRLAGELGGDEVQVDAVDGRVAARRPLALAAQGRVFENDPATDKGQTKDLPLPGLAEGASKLVSSDGKMSVYQYAGGKLGESMSVGPSPGPSSGGDFLYDPPADPGDEKDPFAAVNAYYHAARLRAFFEDKMGLSMVGDEWRLSLIVNARAGGEPLNMAFFSPVGASGTGDKNTIAMGQGKVDFALDRDTLAHEFTHYVCNRAIGYNKGQFAWDEGGFTPLTGAIDEGMADYFAASLGDDSFVGDTLPPGWGRDVAGGGGRCPEDIKGETHLDGRIITAAAWEIRERVGADMADGILWDALLTLTEGAQPDTFARAVAEASEERQAAGLLTAMDVAKIKGALSSRGLFGCGRELSLDQGPTGGSLLGLSAMGKIYGKSCGQLAKETSLSAPFSYSFRPSKGAAFVRFSVVFDAPKEGDLEWTLLVNRGKPVSFQAGPGGYPSAKGADFSIENSSAQEGEIEIEAPLDGEVFHATLLYKTCEQTSFFLEASERASPGGATLKPRQGEYAGLRPVRFEESAGGCSAAGGVGSGWWLAAGLLAAAARRRRDV